MPASSAAPTLSAEAVRAGIASAAATSETAEIFLSADRADKFERSDDQEDRPIATTALEIVAQPQVLGAVARDGNAHPQRDWYARALHLRNEQMHSVNQDSRFALCAMKTPMTSSPSMIVLARWSRGEARCRARSGSASLNCHRTGMPRSRAALQGLNQFPSGSGYGKVDDRELGDCSSPLQMVVFDAVVAWPKRIRACLRSASGHSRLARRRPIKPVRASPDCYRFLRCDQKS